MEKLLFIWGRGAHGPQKPTGKSLWGFPLTCLLGLMVFGLVATINSALWADGELVRALKSRENFKASQESQKHRGGWLTLIKEFEDAALAQYEPRHASRARFIAAELSYQSGEKFKQNDDYQRADLLAKRAVRDCPRCPHAPGAQLISGQALL
ncbi:MAG: hypothetical protein ACRCTY_10335, partial [Candidatus Adiutrix sp.]